MIRNGDGTDEGTTNESGILGRLGSFAFADTVKDATKLVAAAGVPKVLGAAGCC